MGNETIFWLREIEQLDAPLTGSKAAALGELSRNNFQVPDGFCVSAKAYQAYVTGNNKLASQLQIELSAINYEDFESLRSHGVAIRGLISAIELDKGLAAEIERFYLQLIDRSGTNFVAVRSSSTVEDRQNASGAGQQDTYLNVSGLPDILDSIKKCWASLWNEQAIAYREKNGFPHFNASMAVVVQSMVESETAGVLFTRDPGTGADHFVINASRGLGEAVVAGRVTPDEYLVDRKSLIEIQFRPGQTDPPTTTGGGESSLKKLREGRSGGRCLAPEKVHALAELGLKIESLLGSPQDIEWGLVEDRIYILQSRPITALPVSSAVAFFTDPIPESKTLWTSAFFRERFPQPVSPLGWSLIKDLIVTAAISEPLRFTGLTRFDESRFVRLHQGHPFVNVQAYQMMFKYFPEALMPADAPTFFPGGDMAMRKKVDFPRFSNFIFSVAKTLLSRIDWTPWNYLFWNRFALHFSKEVDQIEAEIEGSRNSSVVFLLERVERLNRLCARLLGLHRWSLVYANVLMTILKRTVRSWTHFNNPDEVSLNLLGGLSNQTTLLDQELWKLGRLAEKLSETGRETYILGADEELLKRTMDPDYANGMELRAQFMAFLKKFGHRSTSLDVLYPPYRSDPAQVLKLVNDAGPIANTVSPEAKVEGQRRVRLAETDRVKLALSQTWLDRLFPIRWLYFRTGLTFTQIYMQVRESQRFYWQKSLAVQRRALLSIAAEFSSQGIFQSQAGQNDIFYLTLPEIKEFAANKLDPAELHQRIADRKDEFSRLRRFYYPPFLEGNLPLIPLSTDHTNGIGTKLQGIPISAGIVQGRAHVITSPAEISQAIGLVGDGDILITIATDPGWTPLFSRLGGLVMETGGQLSHGAVVAREYGIPAVAGIVQATTLIKDGDLILLNGNDGSVIRM
jgi:phosphohistidine swiveling domain-containing protein